MKNILGTEYGNVFNGIRSQLMDGRQIVIHACATLDPGKHGQKAVLAALKPIVKKISGLESKELGNCPVTLRLEDADGAEKVLTPEQLTGREEIYAADLAAAERFTITIQIPDEKRAMFRPASFDSISASNFVHNIAQLLASFAQVPEGIIFSVEPHSLRFQISSLPPAQSPASAPEDESGRSKTIPRSMAWTTMVEKERRKKSAPASGAHPLLDMIVAYERANTDAESMLNMAGKPVMKKIAEFFETRRAPGDPRISVETAANILSGKRGLKPEELAFVERVLSPTDAAAAAALREWNETAPLPKRRGRRPA